MNSGCTCILLAAGNSSRFGSSKMLHRLGNGLSLLESTVNLYTRVFGNVTVVIRHDCDQLKVLLKSYPVTVIESPNAQEGLSQSIVVAVQAASGEGGFLIGLGDMPFAEPATLRLMKQRIQNSDRASIVAVSMGGRLGNPVWFGQSHRNELLNLSGDIGAKAILKSNPSAITTVEVEDNGIFWDVDTPSDLAYFLDANSVKASPVKR